MSSNINSLVVPATRIAFAESETDAISIDKESITGISRYSYNAFTEIRILDMEDFTEQNKLSGIRRVVIW